MTFRCSYASMIATLSPAGRQALRAQLEDPDQPLPDGCPLAFRQRWLQAIDVVELMGEPAPTLGVILETRDLIGRVKAQ